LRKIGRTLGAASGTGPDDDPLLRTVLRESRADGRSQGHAEGHAQGRNDGRLETRRDAVLQVLQSRGVPASAALPRHLAEFTSIPTAALVQAALQCRDEDDLLHALRRQLPPAG
jgi:hypothetical protein